MTTFLRVSQGGLAEVPSLTGGSELRAGPGTRAGCVLRATAWQHGLATQVMWQHGRAFGLSLAVLSFHH